MTGDDGVAIVARSGTPPGAGGSIRHPSVTLEVHVLTLSLFAALANTPIVTVGTDLVAGAPVRTESPVNAWVPVVADCLDEGRLKRVSVVDRSHGGLTAASLVKDVEALRALDPSAVVIGVGAHEVAGDAAVFHDQVADVVRLLRAEGGPQVYLVGLVAPTLAQVAGKDDRPQPALDESIAPFNEALAKVAAADDGVWRVDLWAAWPKEPTERARMTEGAYALTDLAHARVGAVICEQILANLRNRRK